MENQTAVATWNPFFDVEGKSTASYVGPEADLGFSYGPYGPCAEARNRDRAEILKASTRMIVNEWTSASSIPHPLAPGRRRRSAPPSIWASSLINTLSKRAAA